MLRQIMARNLALARTRLLLALCFHAAAAAATPHQAALQRLAFAKAAHGRLVRGSHMATHAGVGQQQRVGVGLDGVGARVVRRPLRACWPPI
jgi:hypothetical protein